MDMTEQVHGLSVRLNEVLEELNSEKQAHNTLKYSFTRKASAAGDFESRLKKLEEDNEKEARKAKELVKHKDDQIKALSEKQKFLKKRLDKITKEKSSYKNKYQTADKRV